MKKIIHFLLIALAVCLFAGASAQAETKSGITIHAKRYAFEPAEITLKKGQTATLLLVTDDVDHGLAVPGLGIRADIVRGQTSKVTVTPAVTGDFTGTCSRFCGGGHTHMRFVVHVVP